MVKEEIKQRIVGNCKTLGPAELPKPDPSHFLRSHTGLNIHKSLNVPYKENICPGKRPPLPDFRKPSVKEKPLTINFVSQNKLRTVLSEAKQPIPTIVDAKDGHKYKVLGSGLTKDYILRKVS